jgi:hypothetical protein
MQILRFPNTEKFEHINLVCVFNQEKRKKVDIQKAFLKSQQTQNYLTLFMYEMLSKSRSDVLLKSLKFFIKAVCLPYKEGLAIFPLHHEVERR